MTNNKKSDRFLTDIPRRTELEELRNTQETSVRTAGVAVDRVDHVINPGQWPYPLHRLSRGEGGDTI